MVERGREGGSDGYLSEGGGGGAAEPGNFLELVRGTRKNNVRADDGLADGRTDGRTDVIWRSCLERRSANLGFERVASKRTPFSHRGRQ